MAFLATGHAMADEVTVSDITIPQNAPATLSISMTNEGTYRQLFQLRIVLPEGVTMVANSQKLSNRFGANAQLQYNEVQTRVYQFVCQAGLDTNPISGNSGELMTVDLQVDPELAVGTVMQGSITEIEVTTTDVKAWNPADVPFNISVGEPADLRVVLDELSTTPPVAAEGADVRVMRTIYADEWSTICLPFSMTEEQVKATFGEDVELADFTGTESEFDNDENLVGIQVNFANVSAIEANHPYIIKVPNAMSEFTVYGVDIVPDEDDAYIEYDNGKTGSRRVVYSGFYGTYHAATVVPKNCLFLNGNLFWYSTGQTKMKAFRAYFEFLDILADVENSTTRILMSFDGEATDVKGKDIVHQGKTGDTPVYNLQGQRVENAGKGLYIINNKKVLVK